MFKNWDLRNEINEMNSYGIIILKFNSDILIINILY